MRLLPVDIPQRKGDPVVVDTDEHPRASTTAEALGKTEACGKSRGYSNCG